MPDLENNQEGLETTNSQEQEANSQLEGQQEQGQEAPQPDPELSRYKSFVEESGGEEQLKSAKELFNTIAAPADEFEPGKFWDHVADLAPSRYDAIVYDLVEKHPDFFTNIALQKIGMDKQSFDDYKGWISQGRPTKSSVASEMDIDPADLDPEDPKDRILLKAIETEKWRKQRELADDEQRKKQAEWQQQQYQQKVMELEGDFNQSRLTKIDQFTAKLNLDEKDPLAARVKKYINWCAQGEFKNNPTASKLYDRALGHVRAGEGKLANGLEGQIDGMLNTHANEVAKFFLDLFNAKKAAGVGKTDEASQRRELPPGGTARVATTTNTQGKPFTREDQLKRLRDLEASGIFPS